ncbi:hypothetical protein RA307_31660 [Xanthobacteraceae bacterium Astr-EGSB]|uniref:hypothetical protein n=1 Tax=Astrobacterium formosum TaxID=3069710 RepID=UPI0027AEEF70|nr:hypothetical protein [Xanthobacteraceae bacterium Astr-EGSB]
MASRIRLIANLFVVAASASEAGALVFEPMTVQGVTGLGLRRARIRDLSVRTLNLKEGSVTVPAYTYLALPSAPVNSFTTFMSTSVTTRGVAGSQIFVMALFDGSATLTVDQGSVTGRCLVNGVAAGSLAAWQIADRARLPSGSYISRAQPQRVLMASLTATGALQTITVEWQAVGGGGYVDAGSAGLSIVMKR